MTEQKLVPYPRRHRLPADVLEHARGPVERALASLLACGCPCAKCATASAELADALRILSDGNAVTPSVTATAVNGTPEALRSARTPEQVSRKHQGGAPRVHQAAGGGDRHATRRGRSRAGPEFEPSD